MKAPKLPKNYQLLYEIVCRTGDAHLTTSDVYLRAKRRQPGIGYSTVYRGLLRLRDAGRIAEIKVRGEPAAYEPVGPEHAHFLCTACGKLTDVDYALPPKTVRTLAQREGYTVSRVFVTLQGRCEACRVET